jgi:type II secretory pathway predicted ATPase ExeA
VPLRGILTTNPVFAPLNPVDRKTNTERDPFSDTTDPAAYVPRTATESVLVQLEMALRDGARVVCLEGPPGSGKTLLLNVLEERLVGDFESLRVPYPKLDPDEFCLWGLSALHSSAAGDAERALADRIANRAATGEPPLVWIVDDADCLPVPTLRSLLWLQGNTGDALRLLLARSGELPGEELAHAGVLPVSVELEGEMDRAEMAQYVRARLVRAGVGPERRAQVESALDPLFARSRGNPRLLHAAASVLLCFGPERLEALVEVEPAESVEPVEPSVTAPGAEGEASAEIADDAGPEPDGISIESLVAEAVAAEQPIEELAIPAPPTTVLVATPEPAPSERAPDIALPPATGPAPPAPRRRHRLRRLGRH